MATSNHVAEFNWGILVDDWGSDRVAEFEGNLGRVNAIAERADGFIWRMTDEEMEFNQLDPEGALGANARLASTLSVWRDEAALDAFVYRTVHGGFVEKGHEWFEKSEKPRYVIWDVPAGHKPSLVEAVEKLDTLTNFGPSAAAYDFPWVRLRNQEAG